MIKGNDNLITALIGGAILMIRNNDDGYIFIGTDCKKINVNIARNLVAYNLVKVAGAEYPHDVYYVSTYDDFIKKSNESQYFKSDMEDSLDIENLNIKLPKELKRNEHEYHIAFNKWRNGDDEDSIVYRKRILSFLNWKQN